MPFHWQAAPISMIFGRHCEMSKVAKQLRNLLGFLTAKGWVWKAAIGGALERSVLETLSSQLDTMFTGPATREKDGARGEADQVVRARLSKRQIQVLRLLGEGKSNKEIAMTLFLSPNTIKLHVSAILERLKLRSRTQAAVLSSTLL